MPICAKCDEWIANQSIVVGETAFHRECFTCAVCGSEIIGEFMIRDGQSICLHCYNDHNPAMVNGHQRMKACSKCGGLIHGTGVKREDEQRFEFHKECLLCMLCQNPLDAVNEAGNVCSDCFRGKLEPVWNKPYSEQVMSDEL